MNAKTLRWKIAWKAFKIETYYISISWSLITGLSYHVFNTYTQRTVSSIQCEAREERKDKQQSFKPKTEGDYKSSSWNQKIIRTKVSGAHNVESSGTVAF